MKAGQTKTDTRERFRNYVSDIPEGYIFTYRIACEELDCDSPVERQKLSAELISLKEKGIVGDFPSKNKDTRYVKLIAGKFNPYDQVRAGDLFVPHSLPDSLCHSSKNKKTPQIYRKEFGDKFGPQLYQFLMLAVDGKLFERHKVTEDGVIVSKWESLGIKDRADLALALLKKSIPDLKSLEVSSNQDSPVQISFIKPPEPNLVIDIKPQNGKKSIN